MRRCLRTLVLPLLCGPLLVACGGAGVPVLAPIPAAPATPSASAPGATAAAIAGARADVRAAVALYRAGRQDAAYEKAASAYLDDFEHLEAALLKIDQTTVPGIEDDFRALRDDIKAARPQSEVGAVATRLDGKLARAAGLLPQ